MNKLLKILPAFAAFVLASFSFAYADAALPPSPVESAAPVAIPAVIVVVAALLIRALKNKRK